MISKLNQLSTLGGCDPTFFQPLGKKVEPGRPLKRPKIPWPAYIEMLNNLKP